MKIAYTTTYDLGNPESWPRRHLGLYGAGAKIVQTLKTDTDNVVSLGVLKKKRSPVTRLKWQFYRNFQQKDFYSWADPIVSRHYAGQIQRQLSQCDADILLCPENAIPLAHVKPDRPMVLWTDTTLGSLIDFYPYLSNLCKETRQNLLKMEKQVLNECSLIILNSQWAAKQAQTLYGVSSKKIKVIPRGSSQTQSLSDEEFETALEQRMHGPTQLLFVGVDWERKGGNIAFGIAEALNMRGIEATLHVVGCTPPFEVPEFVTVHGFVDRTVEKGQLKMAELFRSAHFLLYPTRADAMGVVLSEAASFGVPSLASDIGGVGSVVKTGLTGKTFSSESKPEAYGNFIAEHVTNPDQYCSLARSTFEHYKENVSWPTVGNLARTAFNSLLAH
ncbi:MAG: glycosyltransferase family 4 protein [Cyanobacteria bacterium P01_C01_bin.69]